MHVPPATLTDARAAEGALAAEQTSHRLWASAIDSDAFAALLATKVRCVAPLLGLSVVFIVATTLLAGYAKDFMRQKVFGSFNLGYLLVVLTYVVCWVVSVLYVRTANRKFDAQAEVAIEALKLRTAT